MCLFQEIYEDSLIKIIYSMRPGNHEIKMSNMKINGFIKYQGSKDVINIKYEDKMSQQNVKNKSSRKIDNDK